MNPIAAQAMAQTLLQPALTRANSGRFIDMGDHRAYMLMDSQQTGGAFAAFYMEVDPNGAPPVAHYHAREDETFIILEGRFEIEIDNQIIEVGPGDTAFAPRNIPHNWRCVDANGGKAIVIVTPGGFEEFLTSLAAMLPPTGPEDMAENESPLSGLRSRAGPARQVVPFWSFNRRLPIIYRRQATSVLPHSTGPYVAGCLLDKGIPLTYNLSVTRPS